MSDKKILGTFIPLSALYTQQAEQQPHGTIADGIAFIDWLKKHHQHAWQMLPLHETQLKPHSKTDHVASPYKGYGIGLDPKYSKEEFQISNVKFQMSNDSWLADYALFCALRDHFGTDNWTLWDKDIRLRETNAINNWKEKLQRPIYRYTSQQEEIHHEYKQLRNKAKEKDIKLIGDLPFYLPLHSPLTWMYQHIFLINEDGSLPRVSGVTNGPKATYGRQVWGHPLYRWEIPMLHQDIISLFKLRLAYLSELFDIVRIDHANGFFLYGSLDPSDETNDKTVVGPGITVFKQLIHYANEIGLGIFAEDAAVELKHLRYAMHTLGVPGIRIFRYAYDDRTDIFENDYDNPAIYPENTVAYTTTHDTETLMGWMEVLPDDKKRKLLYRILHNNGAMEQLSNHKLSLTLRNAVINSPS